MKAYTCSVCGYVYDEAKGIPNANIAPGTKWEDIPEDWVCPLCGAGKEAFKEVQAQNSVDTSILEQKVEVDKELSPLELSVICSNLARGCEKQYMQEQSDAFRELADFFKSKADESVSNDFDALKDLVMSDLENGYPYANAIAGQKPDRGALRSLVWSEKVTNMLQSLILRYEKEGDAMLKNTGVYVCTICGFISVGDYAPELCPVCKVPAWKFEKVERRYA